MDIKQTIKAEMKLQEMSKRQLSDATGINYNTLATFLKVEKSSIRIDKVEKILSALGLGIINFNNK